MRRAWWMGIVLAAAALGLAAQAPLAPAQYAQLRFRYIGPPGNRTDAVAGVPGDPLTYYAGAASGGIWKSGDGGIHWRPIFDAEPAQSIGALAVAASDANIVWAGTGESFIRSHISIGDGIYKSLDAGATWTRMGLDRTGRIGRIVIDPRNPDIVLACALGTAYGPQPERGVFRSEDGGKTWQKTLFVDENTGCSDIAMDPANPRVLYAGMWQLVIHTWGRTSGGPGSGLYRSSDEGLTWTELSGHGLPNPPIGKIGLAIAPSYPERVYALIETGDGVPWNGRPTQLGQLWRSDDAGATWQLVSSNRYLRSRTAYYTRAAVASDNSDEIYFLGDRFTRSLDGGRTLTPIGSPGGDNHDMWIAPRDSRRMIVANDSGVSVTVNGGATWDHVQLPIAQIYHVTLDDQIPYHVYGNKQDGAAYEGPSQTGGPGPEIGRGLWHAIGGGESGFATPDPHDPNRVWSSGTGSGSIGGAVFVYDRRNGQSRDVEVWPDATNGAPADAIRYRFNWEFPLAISPLDPNTVYVGSQYVHQTTDGGQSWRVISPDLTLNDKSREGISGGLTPDNIGVEYAGVVFALAVSPLERGLIWAGTNDGQVQITRDGGGHWTNVTKNIPGLPPWGTVSNIQASRYAAGTAYITVDFHQVDNRDPFVYRSDDYGRTWKSITDGVPHTMLSYAHCLREDPWRRGLLYLGTENALYVSFDDGDHWQPLQQNLPHAPVYWIATQKRRHDLVLATYGRGFWVLDDVSPLEQLTPPVAASASYLFAPRPAYRFRGRVRPAGESYDPAAGFNPPYGADLNYYLKAAAPGGAQIEILNAAGEVVRTLQGPGEAGINRVWWDLRSAPTPEVRLRTLSRYMPDAPLGPRGWRSDPVNRPVTLLEPPGAYTVRLRVGGATLTGTLAVLKDPAAGGTEADVTAQFRLARALYGQIAAVSDEINRIESVRAQLLTLERSLPPAAAADTQARAIDEKLAALEEHLFQTKVTGRGEDTTRYPPEALKRLGHLLGDVTSSDFAPTTQDAAVAQLLAGQIGGWQAEFEHVASGDLAALNAALRSRRTPHIIVPTMAPAGRGEAR